MNPTQKLKPNAIARHRRYERAIDEASKVIAHSRDPRWPTPDDYNVEHLGLPTVDVPVLRRLADGREIHLREWRVVISPYLARTGSFLYRHARERALRGDPDAVILTHLREKDNWVYVSAHLDRVIQRQMHATLTPPIERVLSPHAHAYRLGRSPTTALRDVRDHVRRGFRYLLCTDVHDYFSSISLNLVDEALVALCPEVGPAFRSMLQRHLRPPVLVRPEHARQLGCLQWQPIASPGHLLRGSVLAPLLANLAGQHVLDGPFVAAMGDDAFLFRYSDDIMILARTEAACEHAFDVLMTLVDKQGWALNPRKTVGPIDTLRGSMPWLGKEIIGHQVRTPDARLRTFVDRLAATDPTTAKFRNTAYWVLDELWCDPARRPDDLRRRLRPQSAAHAAAFSRILTAWRARRGKAPARPWSLEEDHDLAAAIRVHPDGQVPAHDSTAPTTPQHITAPCPQAGVA
ncbi:MAG: reverse transcriptase domain-containing protein [Proteobacteria bacterium]|jgi:hypothetical protein|nr:reverse transcriptase domain-containing protein [Pseudomonadota bacterium]